MKMSRILFALIFLLFSATYTHAAKVSGKVSFKGKVPQAKVIKTGKYAKVCGPEFVDESFIVNDGGLKNVVIWVSGKGIKKLKTKPGSFVLDQTKCRYEPRMVVMPRGSELEIRTQDPINHNIHTYSFDNDPINIMFTPGQDHIQEFEEPEPIKVECDLHAWMKAWIIVTPSSFYGVSDPSGKFSIPDLPPGKYTLNFWHEELGEMSQKIKVDDSDLTVDMEFKPKSSK